MLLPVYALDALDSIIGGRSHRRTSGGIALTIGQVHSNQ